MITVKLWIITILIALLFITGVGMCWVTGFMIVDLFLVEFTTKRIAQILLVILSIAISIDWVVTLYKWYGLVEQEKKI